MGDNKQKDRRRKTRLDSLNNMDYDQDLELSNRFNLLQNEDLNNVNSTLNNDTNANTKHKGKIPPVVIKDQKYDNIRLLMKDDVKIADYKIKINSNGILLNVSNVLDYKKLLNHLGEKNILYYTYELPEDKMVKYVLSGLPNLPIEEISTELKAINVLPADIKVLGFQKKRYDDHQLYIVQFKKGDVTLNQLRKIKFICHVAVRWEYFNKSTNLTQCHNCQKFGHGTKHCHLIAKCGRCGGLHNTKECPHPIKCFKCNEPGHISRECKAIVCAKCQGKHLTSTCTNSNNSNGATIVIDPFIKCANCSGNHTAAYKMCPKRTTYLSKRRESVQYRRSQPVNREPQMLHQKRRNFNLEETQFPKLPSSTVLNNQYMAQFLSSSNQPSGSYTNHKVDNRQNTHEADDLFSAPEIINITKEIFQNLSTARSKVDQILVITNIIVKYVYSNYK